MYLPAIAQAHRQHGLITHQQLLGHGLTGVDVRRLVAAGTILRLRRGVFVVAEAWHDLDPFRAQPLVRMRAAALTLTCAPYAFSHDSSSIALDLGAPDPRSSLVHVSRAKVHGDRVRAGVKHHLAPFRAADLTEVDGLRLLGPARTALDMAREHGRAHGLAACDAAMRSGVSRRELEEVLEFMASWPHSRCMRWCVEHADPLAESYLESLGRDFVIGLGIGTPQCQFGLTDGHTTAFVDIRVQRHGFEVDGSLKYDENNPSGVDGRVVLRREKERTDFLTGFKLGITRLTHHDLHAGRAAAERRTLREFADTCARFGTSIEDLTPFVVTRGRAPLRG